MTDLQLTFEESQQTEQRILNVISGDIDQIEVAYRIGFARLHNPETGKRLYSDEEHEGRLYELNATLEQAYNTFAQRLDEKIAMFTEQATKLDHQNPIEWLSQEDLAKASQIAPLMALDIKRRLVRERDAFRKEAQNALASKDKALIYAVYLAAPDPNQSQAQELRAALVPPAAKRAAELAAYRKEIAAELRIKANKLRSIRNGRSPQTDHKEAVRRLFV